MSEHEHGIRVTEPLIVTHGAVDVFTVRADGLRSPLATMEQGEWILPLSMETVAVTRLVSSVEPAGRTPSPDDVRCFASRVSVTTPSISPDADVEAISAAVVERLEMTAALREASVHESLAATAHHVAHAIERSAYSATELAEPPNVRTSIPLVAVVHLLGQAQGFQVNDPTRHELETTDDAIRLIAHRSSVPYRPVTLTDGWTEEATGSYLAFLEEDGDFVPVALVHRGKGYTMQRSTDLHPQPVTPEALARLERVGIEFYAPLPPDRPVTTREVIRLGMHGSGRLWLLTLLMAGGVALLGLLTPILTNVIIGQIIPQSQGRLLIQVGAALVLAAGVSFIFLLVQNYAVSAISQSATRSMQSAFWGRLLTLPTTFYRQYSSGDLTVRVMAVDALQTLVSVQVVSAVLAAVFGLVNLVLMWTYSPALAIAATIFLALTILLLWLTLRSMGHLAIESLTAMRRATAWMQQLLNGIVKIRIAGAESRMAADYLDLARAQSVAGSRQTLALGRISAWFAFAASGATALFALVVWRGWTPDGASIDTADFMAFSSAYGMAFAAIAGLSALLVPLATAGPIFSLLRPIMDTVPESGGNLQDPGRLTGHIELRELEFRYTEDGPLILKGLNLTMQPGEMVALVGPSGAGKSTITRLLLGFEKADSGQVLFDGRNIEDIDPTLLRAQMGVVVQSGKIIRGSIMRNILGSASGDVDLAWEAAEQAALADDIRAMPMKMETIVDPSNISGGQAQRILLARALARRPSIVILDEATSALDNKAQAQITAAMNELSATRIVIAHRLSTIRQADRIVVMVDGREAEMGSFDELMERNGVFASLVKRQMA